MTAVQSVYMKGLGSAQVGHIVGLGALLLLAAGPAHAGIDFTGCTSGPDGSITCNTVPTGNTLTDDIDARYGLDMRPALVGVSLSPTRGLTTNNAARSDL